MARINLPDHWKFKRLARAVGSRVIAWGLLESTWWAAYAVADPYIGNADDIADACDWSRVARLLGQSEDPTVLVELLTACGFLDEPSPGRYVVHDLWDHAPQFVRLRWTREHPNETPPWHGPPDKTTSSVDSQDVLIRPGPARPVQRKTTPASRSSALHVVATTPNPTILAKVAHDHLHGQTFATGTDLKEAIKDLAVQYRLPFDGDSLARALDLLERSRRPVLVASLPIRFPRRRRA